MFTGLVDSTLISGKYDVDGRGEMFAKSQNLNIEGGTYTSSGSSSPKSETTQKSYRQGVYIIV